MKDKWVPLGVFEAKRTMNVKQNVSKIWESFYKFYSIQLYILVLLKAIWC